MEHKRVSKFKIKITYKFNNGIKTPLYAMVAKYKDLETGSIDRITLKEFGCSQEAEDYTKEQNKLAPLVFGADSAREYLLEKIFPRFEDKSLLHDLKNIDEEVMVRLVSVLRSDDQAMSQATEKIKALSITEEVKNSIKKLGRNEQKLIVNIYVAQAILVSSIDFLKDMPEHKKQSAKPAINLLVNLGDVLDELNSLFAYQMKDSLSQAQYDNTVIEALRLVNIMTGKWEKCNTCVFADTQKSIVKKELREAIAENGAL